MAFDLSQVKRTKTDRPPRLLIHGLPKVGKSTFAAGAPGAVFLRTEDGLENIEAEAFPLCASWQDLLDQVGVLYAEPHDYKTVVLDSADWAERLCFAHVVANVKTDKGVSVKSIEGYGYGKGYNHAADAWNELLAGLTALRDERGMGVVMIAHSEIKRFDDPMADSYDRYQIKLSKGIAKICQEWADAIGFAHVQTMTRNVEIGREDKRALGLTGQRKLALAANVAHESGNRYGLPDSVDLNWPAFEAALNQARGVKVDAENNTSAAKARKGNK